MSKIQPNIVSISSVQEFLIYLDEQIYWHDKKSVRYKRIFVCLKLLIFLLTGSITIVSTVNYANNSDILSFLIVILASLIGFCETVLQCFQFEKLSLLYRNYVEELTNEKVFFQTRPLCDNENEYFERLVNNTQAISLKINHKWYDLKTDKDITNSDKA